MFETSHGSSSFLLMPIDLKDCPEVSKIWYFKKIRYNMAKEKEFAYINLHLLFVFAGMEIFFKGNRSLCLILVVWPIKMFLLWMRSSHQGWHMQQVTHILLNFSFVLCMWNLVVVPSGIVHCYVWPIMLGYLPLVLRSLWHHCTKL